MYIEQFVMAYKVEQDRLRAILPEGFGSIRPVLRINAEIKNGEEAYLEFNVPVEHENKKGWLNIAAWQNMDFTRDGDKVTFKSDFINISFKAVGIKGGCPAEKDNCGCFFLGDEISLRLPEEINENKEFCDCEFKWSFSEGDAEGASIGKTLPAFFEESKKEYPKVDFTAENAAAIPCLQVLGTYKVAFERKI